ncbi:MAG TPA: delta-60 repeat domain-containing protein, partial [Myxococcales bacterium]|nr:delta-60 repeat domain-containing protein [Myxococcales bacterium]
QTECYQAVVQPIPGSSDYKLVTTGYGRDTEAQTTDIVSLRLTSNGQLDTTYGTNGAVRIDVGGFADNSRHVLVLPDRRIMLVGGGRPADAANVDGWIGMLMPDGQPDTGWDAKGWKTMDLGGPADFLWSLALSPDSKTVAVVGFRGVGNIPSTSTLNDDTALVLLPVQ